METKAPSKQEEFLAKLDQVQAIPATEFGQAVYGWSQPNTAMAIARGTFPLPTWQTAPRGKHYVSTQAVREHLVAAGISL